MSIDNITHLTISRLSDEQLITDILLEYSDELDKAPVTVVRTAPHS